VGFEDIDSVPDDSLDELGRDELNSIVVTAKGALNPREVDYLDSRLAGDSFKEISTRTGEPVGTIRSVVSRSKRKLRPLLASAAVFVGAVAFWAFYRSVENAKPPTPHQILAIKASDAYDTDRYDEASDSATKCIEQVDSTARRLQKEIAAKHASLPIGSVYFWVRWDLLRNGPLNDVGLAYNRLGWAYKKTAEKLTSEPLKRETLEKARAAFKACVELSFARCYDPSQNTFWDPSEQAQSQLEKLNKVEK